MKLKLLLFFLLLSINSLFSQNIDWYQNSDGTSAPWGGWEYLDINVSNLVKVDSVYGGFRRPGYPVEVEDFIFSWNLGATYDAGTATLPWSYGEVNTSLYNQWLDLTAENYIGEGTIRVGLPTTAGAIWDSVGIATSSIANNIELNNPDELISIYPNPSTNELNIVASGVHYFKIIDILGNEVTQGRINEFVQVDIESLPKGVYFLKVGEIRSIKFIKN